MTKTIITIERRDGRSPEEFVRYEREVHRPLLTAIPEAGRYIRRFVVSHPIPAPNYSGHVNFMDLPAYGRIVAEEEVVVG